MPNSRLHSLGKTISLLNGRCAFIGRIAAIGNGGWFWLARCALVRCILGRSKWSWKPWEWTGGTDVWCQWVRGLVEKVQKQVETYKSGLLKLQREFSIPYWSSIDAISLFNVLTLWLQLFYMYMRWSLHSLWWPRGTTQFINHTLMWLMLIIH